MAKISSKKRDKMPKSQFGLPGSKSYPMPDKKHAAVAKGRAKQQLNKGKLSKSGYQQVVAKANKKLGKGKGK